MMGFTYDQQASAAQFEYDLVGDDVPQGIIIIQRPNGTQYNMDRIKYFDQFGRINDAGRDYILRKESAQPRKSTQGRRVTFHSDVVGGDENDEREDDNQGALVVASGNKRSLSPEALQMAQLFTPERADAVVVVEGGQRVVTSELVAMLHSMSNEQLLNVLPNIVAMPEPVAVIAPEHVTIERLHRVFHETIDLAGEITADMLDQFFKVRCENREILDLYVQWLQQRLVPLMSRVLMHRKNEVEQYYVDLNHKMQQAEDEKRQEVEAGLARVDEAQQRTKIKGGLVTTAITALPLVVLYSSPFSGRSMVQHVLYGSCLTLVAVEVTMIASRLSELTGRRSGLLNSKNRMTQNITELRALPKKMSESSYAEFQVQLGKFVSEMQNKIDRLEQTELQRIDAELRAMQLAAARPIAVIEDISDSPAVGPVAAPVPKAAVHVSARQRVHAGLGAIFRGLSAVTKGLGS